METSREEEDLGLSRSVPCSSAQSLTLGTAWQKKAGLVVQMLNRALGDLQPVPGFVADSLMTLSESPKPLSQSQGMQQEQVPAASPGLGCRLLLGEVSTLHPWQ